MRKILLVSLFAFSLASSAAMAQDWRHHDEHWDRWHNGSWYHGFHDGRDGWWWTVDGAWYYYPAPVYPYPQPYGEAVVVEQPAAPPAPPAPGQPQTMWYCHAPAGYYPSVPECPSGWQQVAAAPAAPVAAPQSPAGTRPADEQELNLLTVQFRDIDVHAKHARTKLAELSKKVEEFHQELFNRGYNAMDLLKASEDLKRQIEVQRDILGKKPVPAASLPPGTPVQMPDAPPTPVPPPQ